MIKKHTILGIFVVTFVVVVTFSSPVRAHEDTSTTTENEVQEVTVDLGISDPGLLPTSKLYFVKEWSRGIRQFFTFNPIKKAELELTIANQKAAELQKLKEVSPENVDAIERALSNYNETADKLKARLESLQSSSSNPKIENLLEKIATQTLKHELLFNNLKSRFEKQKLREKIEASERKVGDTLAKVSPKEVAGLITKAEQLVNELENKINNTSSSANTPAQKLLENAKTHLLRAKSAEIAKKYGEAFGQATAAVENAKNGLRVLESPKAKDTHLTATTSTDVGRAVNKKEGRTWKVGIVSGGEFRPSELKIKKGDTVTWVNLDKEGHWPASSPHPEHTGYPETGGCIGSTFDSCKLVPPGGSFKFVFNQAGTRQYHDHLHPGNTGTVIVEE